jgi:GH15 family glucan-1,4-alpha-glucosidase
MAERDAYPPIEALAAIGDGHSMALLGPDARVEWFCPTRFDAAPAVWPLLDRAQGGHLHIAPVDCVCTDVAYLPGTGVLRYEWAGSLGRARMTVAMRWPQEGHAQEILWLLEGLEGQVSVEVAAQFRTDWGRRACHLTTARESASWTNGELAFQITGPVALEQFGDRAVGNGTLTAGQRWGFRLRVAPHAVAPSFGTTADEVADDVDATIRHWRHWVEGIDYDGHWYDAVVRSAITLKMLIYEPTGAVVAAATTSLPEELGGVRNWDYRYTWLRDAGFTLNVLYLLGCTDEARAYAQWLCRTTAAHDLPLRVMYGIDGRTDLPEQELIDLDGYRGSRPVRVGNAAEHQLQLDSYGELMDCLTICEILGEETMHDEWLHFRRLVDFVADHWREPDSGIWEVRDRPRHFVHSKAMAWVALDRGCRLVQTHALEGDHEWWRREADALRVELLEHGVVEGRFRRAYDDDTVDASLLMLPGVGFIDGSDPLVAATIDAVRAQLTPPNAVHDALLWRYLATAGDGLPGHEGAFGIASFWLVEALAMAGRYEDAAAACEALLGLSGPAGLFAEEFDPATGAHLGNTPQAFTHIGLLNAVLRLEARSLRADGRATGEQSP